MGKGKGGGGKGGDITFRWCLQFPFISPKLMREVNTIRKDYLKKKAAPPGGGSAAGGGKGADAKGDAGKNKGGKKGGKK